MAPPAVANRCCPAEELASPDGVEKAALRAVSEQVLACWRTCNPGWLVRREELRGFAAQLRMVGYSVRVVQENAKRGTELVLKP